MTKMKPTAIAAEPVSLHVGAARPDDRDFEETLVSARSRLFRVALLVTGSSADAEDLTQKALLKAWQARRRFRGGSSLYTWLYRILMNLNKDGHRARIRGERWLEEFERERRRQAKTSDPEGLVVRAQSDRRLHGALAGLEPRLREILVLRHFEELSYDEIASVVDCPIGTVRSRPSTARARLRAAMTGAGEGGS